jgi:hypothetical protein
MQALLKFGVLLFLTVAHVSVVAAPTALPRTCVNAIVGEMPDWKPLEPPKDAGRWAKERRLNPVVARGDFDGDGRADFAALGVSSGRARLALCTYPNDRVRLTLVAEPGCSDLIYRTRAGSRLYNFDTGRRETIAHDGVSVRCFEKSGFTYVLGKGGLRAIPDSD